MSLLRRVLWALLAIALLAGLYVGAKRERQERYASHVEIAMDWGDLLALARSYDYNPRQLLIAMRRAGLTSIAVSEELGGSVNSDGDATAVSGQALIDQARLGGIADTELASLLHHGKIDPDAVYLTILNKQARDRYLTQLRLHFDHRSVRILRATPPYLVAIRTQLDYFNALGLGLPAEPLQMARELDLRLIPRLQNDERFGYAQIGTELHAALVHERVSTLVFFGTRNQVLGYPDHITDTATALREAQVNYGAIETYDASQIQKGSEDLAREAFGQTVRVQAISKAELDKLDFETVVARYLLGARERNIRLLYIRPLLHREGTMSLQATNVELIRRLATGLTDRNLHIGGATPIRAFHTNPLFLTLISLAVPAVILLMLDMLGVSVSWFVVGSAIGVDLLIVAAGLALHHELAAMKVLALLGGMSFATFAVVVLAPNFKGMPPRTLLGACSAGLFALVLATAVSLAGALVVVGLVSTPLTMEEIERFTGVKAILLLPPLLVIAAYLFSGRFTRRPVDLRDTLLEPVRAYQMVIAVVLLAAAVLYLVRSGNQSDIAPSAFELALRSKLTALLSVRPRFKEFLVGFPAMMLLPSLTARHRHHVGWIIAIAIAIGTSDIIDTFSHLHTPLFVSLLRILNGAVIGIILGFFMIALYRRMFPPEPLVVTYEAVSEAEIELEERVSA